MKGFPLPEPDFEPTRPFFEAAARGELAIPRCRACGGWVWYPADACRACGGADLPWTAVSGRGTLFTWAVVRRTLAKPLEAPFVTGLVALEEDPSVRLVTRIVDCEPDALRVDAPVEVVFRTLSYPDAGGFVAPLFRPATGGNAETP